MHTTEAEEKRYAELQQMALDFARHGQTESLAMMLGHGLPVNLADAKGNTLLMLAAYNGNVETTRMLLNRGADVDRRNDRGQTPLGGVAFKGYETIVALLLEHNANLDADNGAGMTPIMFAALFGRHKVVEQLRTHGASLERRNSLGISARWIVRFSALFARFPDSTTEVKEAPGKEMIPPQTTVEVPTLERSAPGSWVESKCNQVASPLKRVTRDRKSSFVFSLLGRVMQSTRSP